MSENNCDHFYLYASTVKIFLNVFSFLSSFSRVRMSQTSESDFFVCHLDNNINKNISYSTFFSTWQYYYAGEIIDSVLIKKSR
jgi:hypothetical protein